MDNLDKADLLLTLVEAHLEGLLSDDEFVESVGLMEKAAGDIKAKHPGILDLPEGAFSSWSVDKLVRKMISLAKSKGKGAVSRAVNNIARWQSKRAPELAAKARSVMAALKKSKKWQNIPSKSK